MLQLNSRAKAQLTNTTIVQAENQSNQEVLDMIRKKHEYRDGLLQQIRDNQERRIGLLQRGRRDHATSADVQPVWDTNQAGGKGRRREKSADGAVYTFQQDRFSGEGVTPQRISLSSTIPNVRGPSL